MRSFLLAIMLACSGAAAAATIDFTTIPSDTTYLSNGLLLSSSSGSYSIGGCGNESAGSNGCLGNGSPSPFTGQLTFTFVALGTTFQAVTDQFELIMCEGCDFAGSSAQVFDGFGNFLASIDMNTDSGLGNRTFSYSNAIGIGSLVIDLGVGGDAVQTIGFGSISEVPIPASLWLFGSALAGLGWMRRKQAV
jgi:hypothetical protein